MGLQADQEQNSPYRAPWLLPCDYDYKLWAPHTAWDTALRGAVLPWLVPAQYQTDDDQCLAGQAGLLCWRRRLLILRQAGWLPTKDKLPYLRNCPPAGFRTKPADRCFCRQQRVCPWCWARVAVGAAYAPLWALIEELRQQDDVATEELAVATYKRSIATTASGAYGEAQGLQEAQKRLWTRAGAVGGMLLASVTPRERDPGSCLVTARCLVLTHRPLPEVPRTSRITGLTWPEINLGRLGKLVSRFASYPAAMLHAKPAAVVALLEQTPPRLLRAFGRCYGWRATQFFQEDDNE